MALNQLIPSAGMSQLEVIVNRCFLLCVLFLLSSCAGQFNSEQELAAVNSAEAWLENFDNGDMESVWLTSSRITTDKYAKAALEKYWMGRRNSLGAVVSRDLQYNWKVGINRGSLPDGTHRRIMYWSKYEKRAFVKELIVITLEDGQWKVIERLLN